MKASKILYFSTLIFSMAVGLWHFFVPTMFQWYDYLPMQYENLIVGIDWTNFCFSALLSGISFLLILWGKRTLHACREAKELYVFLAAIWSFRACLALFIEPWPLEPIAWAAVLQLVLSCLMALMTVIESVMLYRMPPREDR